MLLRLLRNLLRRLSLPLPAPTFDARLMLGQRLCTSDLAARPHPAACLLLGFENLRLTCRGNNLFAGAVLQLHPLSMRPTALASWANKRLIGFAPCFSLGFAFRFLPRSTSFKNGLPLRLG